MLSKCCRNLNLLLSFLLYSELRDIREFPIPNSQIPNCTGIKFSHINSGVNLWFPNFVFPEFPIPKFWEIPNTHREPQGWQGRGLCQEKPMASRGVHVVGESWTLCFTLEGTMKVQFPTRPHPLYSGENSRSLIGWHYAVTFSVLGCGEVVDVRVVCGLVGDNMGYKLKRPNAPLHNRNWST